MSEPLQSVAICNAASYDNTVMSCVKPASRTVIIWTGSQYAITLLRNLNRPSNYCGCESGEWQFAHFYSVL